MASTATFSIAADGDDMYTYGGSTTGAWPPPYSQHYNVSTVYAGKNHNSAGTTSCGNVLLRWNTSSLPDNAIILSTQLRITVEKSNSDSGRNLCISNYVWNGTSTDYTTSSNPSVDLKKVLLDDLSFYSTTGGPTTLTMDLDGFASTSFVNKTGNTYMRLTIDGGKPVNSYLNNITFTAFSSTTGNKAQLIVNWDVPDSVGMVAI